MTLEEIQNCTNEIDPSFRGTTPTFYKYLLVFIRTCNENVIGLA